MGNAGARGVMLKSIFWFRLWPRAEWDQVKTYKIPFGVAICLGALWAQLSPQLNFLNL